MRAAARTIATAFLSAWPERSFSRVRQRGGVGGKDAVAHLLDAVALVQILLDELHRLDQVARQQDLELLEAAGAEPPAYSHNTAFAGHGLLGELGNRHADQVGGVRLDMGGDVLRRRQQAAPQVPDTGESAARERSRFVDSTGVTIASVGTSKTARPFRSTPTPG